MQYRKDKNGRDISILGYGCMRFTKKGNSIDLDKAEKEIMAAYNAGVNYYDTAYIYPGSEVALGEILKKNNIRDKVYVATKLPQYLIKSRAGIDKYFDEQLKRLQTDYVDYYLMHMLSDVASWEKMCRLGIKEWIDEKKKSGQIKNIGFSYHGNTDMFIQVLNAYDWDFCQVQYNYLDEHSQAGRKGVEAAYEKGIPVIIMEPLRGGKLVNLLPDKAKNLIAENERHYTPAGWAFKWLWNQPSVTCVLSGMNTMEMVEENIKTADETAPGSFTDDDFALIEAVKKEINAKIKVGCTACGYCMPCPKGIDIPMTFYAYNVAGTEGRFHGLRDYFQNQFMRKEFVFPSACVGCGKCESHCPQHIEIRKELKNSQKVVAAWYVKLAAKCVRAFKFW